VSGPVHNSEGKRSLVENIFEPIAVLVLAGAAGVIWRWLAARSNSILAGTFAVTSILCVIALAILLWPHTTGPWRRRLIGSLAGLLTLAVFSFVAGLLIGPGRSAEISWYVTGKDAS
jgi:hypothetical protein